MLYNLNHMRMHGYVMELFSRDKIKLKLNTDAHDLFIL